MDHLQPISINKVQIIDSFWSPRQRQVQDTVIPYQWAALNDAIPDVPPSHAIRNFRVAAGMEEGSFDGRVFQDSDVAKWLETVGYIVTLKRDEALEQMADGVIDLLEQAQQPDGYLNTHFQIVRPQEKWTNLRDAHELYCAGHLIEAAVAYYEATGKTKLLHIVCRLADHIASVLGNEPGKKRGYSGHPEIELALVKLYRATGNRAYLELSKYFIDERGQQPSYFASEAAKRQEKRDRPYVPEYSQSHLPIREQTSVEGHSVRAMYLYSGVADIAIEYQDESLFEVCKRIWRNTTGQRMYVTGGIGSSAYQEKFTIDYDLPNDRAYTETCAAIGLILFAHRMLQFEANSEYADIMERVLFNGMLSGISLDGKSYFYVNPLEVWPAACDHREDMWKVHATRQGWFGCACCPPNIARLLASLGQYIYSVNESKRELYVHLYIGSRVTQTIGANRLEMVQQGGYPWDGKIRLDIRVDEAVPLTIALRLPGWCRNPQLKVNGEAVDLAGCVKNGYALVNRLWQDEDRIELELPMPVEVIRSHPNLRVNTGKVALQRGPVVFCLEEADNGHNLSDITLLSDAPASVEFAEQLLGGVPVITAAGIRTKPEQVGAELADLYTAKPFETVPATVTAIPYFAWSNRQPGEMIVWIREASGAAYASSAAAAGASRAADPSSQP